MHPHSFTPSLSKKKKVWIVVPVFNESKVLPELLSRLKKVIAVAEVDCRVMFVDDGSSDGTGAQIEHEIANSLHEFQLVTLSRNFGHQAALTAGLAHASHADAVITMDADLQDPPEVIPKLIVAWQQGAEVVLAVRTSRKEGGVRRLGFEVFHRFFQHLSDFPIENNTGTFGLLDRAVVQAFNQLPEQHRFFPGLRAWVGFNRKEIYYDRLPRAAGEPAVTLRRLTRYALDGVFSFSRLPLRLLTYAGLLIAGGGFAIGLFFIVRRLLGFEIASTGFTTLVTLILFLGGVQLIAIGVIGEYLGRIYDEVKRRPHYIVKGKTGF
jgi:glycosyltransferase involved in cell wall biosynthesis